MYFKTLILLLVLFNLGGQEAVFSLDDAFADKLLRLKWIAYAPTNFNPKKHGYPDETSVREDLTILKNAGFNGIVTYGSENSLALIPRIAGEVGFQGVIMGIWLPEDKNEVENAIKQAAYVDGYCVGNEGYKERYNMATLKEAIDYVRTKTTKPVTTTEQINDYFFDKDLMAVGDWLFPNVHPFLQGMRKPKFAASWTQDKFRALKNHLGKDIPILFKESGYPTAGLSGASEDAQEAFFDLLEKTEVPFVYFEAFDQPWKRHLPCEPHWGLFDKNRHPKKFIQKRIK